MPNNVRSRKIILDLAVTLDGFIVGKLIGALWILKWLLITTFINLGLVDVYRLSVHPVILGEGKPLFTDIKQRLNLKMIDTKTFSSGVVQLIYHLNRN